MLTHSRNRFALLCLAATLAFTVATVPAYAQDGDDEAPANAHESDGAAAPTLEQRLEALESAERARDAAVEADERVAELEARVRELEAEREEGEVSSAFAAFLNELDLYGGVVASYTFNLAEPRGRKDANTTRVSDIDHNTFTINAVTLGLELPVSGDDEWDIGFKADVHLGRTVEEVLSLDPEFLGGEEVNLGNAYVSIQVPTPLGPLEVWIGRAAGWFTVESNNLWENPLFNLSNFASFTPYINVGVFARLELAEGLTYMQYVGNGGEVVVDNNHAKTLGGQLAYEVGDLWIGANWLFGAERTDDVSRHRLQLEVDATYAVTETTFLWLMAMYGLEEGVSVVDGHQAQFGGVSLAVRQEFSPVGEGDDAFRRFAVIGRTTVFRDRGGANSGVDATLTEFSAAFEVKPVKQSWVRFEGRLDVASEGDVYPGGNGRQNRREQWTLAVAAGVWF